MLLGTVEARPTKQNAQNAAHLSEGGNIDFTVIMRSRQRWTGLQGQPGLEDVACEMK